MHFKVGILNFAVAEYLRLFHKAQRVAIYSLVTSVGALYIKKKNKNGIKRLHV